MPLVSKLAELLMPTLMAQHVGYDTEAGITATGNTSQANGYAITAAINQVSTVTPTANSATLPVLTSYAHGMIFIFNDDSTDTLYVYPATGEQINQLGANNGVTVTAGTSYFFWAASDLSRWLAKGV